MSYSTQEPQPPHYASPVPQKPGLPGYPQRSAMQPPVNTLAIVSFVSSFFVSIVAIVCGHIALSQIKRSGERGRSFALAGTIIGYVLAFFGILTVFITILIGGMFWALIDATSPR